MAWNWLACQNPETSPRKPKKRKYLRPFPLFGVGSGDKESIIHIPLLNLTAQSMVARNGYGHVIVLTNGVHIISAMYRWWNCLPVIPQALKSFSNPSARSGSGRLASVDYAINPQASNQLLKCIPVETKRAFNIPSFYLNKFTTVANSKIVLWSNEIVRLPFGENDTSHQFRKNSC